MLVNMMSLILLLIIIYDIVYSQNDRFSNCTEIGRCFQECNFETKCDQLPKLPSDLNGKILTYTTSQNGDKFVENYIEWNNSSNNNSDIYKIEINVDKKYQKILGFGGAFTDSMIYNLNQLGINSSIINDILISYFSSDIGSGYTMGRIPIASCDFSTHSYTYAPIQNDFDLKYFNLTVQDFGNLTFLGRIQIINKVKQIMINNNNNNNDNNLFLFATPWSPPFWLKTSMSYIGGSIIDNNTYLETYSNYFIKYLDSYKENGIIINAITPQNEPHSPSQWESCTWSTSLLSKFIANYLGPKIKKFDNNIQIWCYDGQKGFLPEQGIEYFTSNALKYINGIAMHWYIFPPPILGCIDCDGSFKQINEMYKFVNNDNILFISTEACQGYSEIESPPKRGVSLGNINRGQQYAEDIIGDLLSNVSSWNDWNMILDINGGPNHVGNICDAPIIIDIENKKYYKQPMYYYYSHITKYLRPNSIRVEIINNDNNHKNKDILWFTAVIDNNNLNKTIIILLNTDEINEINIEIYDKRFGYMVAGLPPKSIQTILYENL